MAPCAPQYITPVKFVEWANSTGLGLVTFLQIWGDPSENPGAPTKRRTGHSSENRWVNLRHTKVFPLTTWNVTRNFRRRRSRYHARPLRIARRLRLSTLTWETRKPTHTRTHDYATVGTEGTGRAFLATLAFTLSVHLPGLPTRAPRNHAATS